MKFGNYPLEKQKSNNTFSRFVKSWEKQITFDMFHVQTYIDTFIGTDWYIWRSVILDNAIKLITTPEIL